ncbi:MAG: lamin tail domain-containing protein [Verrucomicrobiales bacterium]
MKSLLRASVCIIATLWLSRLPAAPADSAVVFNEIHYHPAVELAESEWIEFRCLTGVRVDMSGWRIDGAVRFDFPEGTVIGGHGFLVVAAAPGAANLQGIGALGPWTGRLDNGGEEIRLVNRDGRIMDSVSYDDEDDWPAGPDGGGVTLTKRDQNSAESRPANWVSSVEQNGTPGRLNFPTAGMPPTITAHVTLESAWRYRADNTPPPPEWKSTGFDDTAWASGPAVLYAGSAQIEGSGQALAAYWPLNETSGTDAPNSVPGAPAGTLNGGVTWVNDAQRGPCLNFSGAAGTHVNAGLATIPQMTLANDFTWAFWAYTFQGANNNVILGNRYSTTAGVEWSPREFIKFTTNQFEFHRNAAGENIDYADIPLNTWMHHAVVKQGAALTYFRNGVASGAITISLGLGHAQPLFFGGERSQENWAGRLDDVALWTRALPASAVASLADGSESPLTAGAPGRLQTQLPLGSTAFYFRNAFQFSGNPARTSVALQLLVDDGAVVCLNGSEVHRANIGQGAVSHGTLASSEVVNAALGQVVTIPGSALAPGTNVIAVEIHQALASGDPDMVFGASLVSTEQPPPPPTFEPGIVINEISPAGDQNFRVELTNLSAQAVNLSGWELATSAGLSYTFGAQSLAPGAFLVIDAAALGLVPAGAQDPPSDGDRLFLYKPSRVEFVDAGSVSNVLQARSTQSDGGWLPESAATFGSANSFSFEADVVINEIMYHPRPLTQAPFVESDEQWVELYNKSTTRTIDLSGWQFREGIDFTFPPNTMLAPGGFLVVARDATALLAKWPGRPIIGNFTRALSKAGERLRLRDAHGLPVDEVRFHDGPPWPKWTDGGGSSLELRDPRADNSRPDAWAASEESGRGSWTSVSYEGLAANSVANDPTFWNEFIFGLLDAGIVLIDDISVIEAPTGANRQLIQNGDFSSGAPTFWRLIGNHRHASIVDDPTQPGNKVLRIAATGPTEHMHNHAETTLKAGASFVTINASLVYRISFRARWVAGSNQLHTRLYFNRLARTTLLPVADGGGTPGAGNSTLLANAGPTFAGLVHFPAVPAANQPATVSVAATDPDGANAATLFYSVNGGAFASIPMSGQGGGVFSGVIPGQAAAAKVQFYVQAADALGATSSAPQGGITSRAVIAWNDGLARLTLIGCQPNNIRINMTNADRDFLHLNTNVMSNDRLGCTIVLNESEIYYDCGVRLKGSERGRNQDVRVGFNIGAPADQLFFGAHPRIQLDRSGAGNQFSQKEILLRHAATHAGGIPESEDDLVRVIAPKTVHTGPAILVRSRFDSAWLDNRYENGSDGTEFEYELIYYPNSTPNGVEGLKVPEPDDVRGVAVAGLGTNREAYRWHFLIDNNQDRDDYAPLMTFLTAFGRPADAQYHTDTRNLMDIDQWLRAFALPILFGVGDHYSSGAQHNLMLFQRPSDGKWLHLPHDMDFTFNTNPANSGSLAPPADLGKLINTNATNRRAYYGHLHDIITTTYNRTYLHPWAVHYSCFLTEDLSGFTGPTGYIETRKNYLLGLINSGIPATTFNITTADGTTSPGPLATIQGDGWVNVREIRLQGAAEPLALTWTDANSFQASVPIFPGSNNITLVAYDFQGAQLATDTVQITGTGTSVPADETTLVISEIMYHPAAASDDEIAAGFADQDDFEFIELTNISTTNTLDLTGVRFASGIIFNFANAAQLAPGQRVVLVKNLAAFSARYPAVPASQNFGVYGPATSLSNGGEEIALVDAGGADIKRFAYGDAAPWPAAADGLGHSLVLIAPHTNPDHAIAANWRPSVAAGGNPGGSDVVAFTGNPTGDVNQDGISNLADYAIFSLPIFTDETTFSFGRSLGADDAAVLPEFSTDLQTWTAGFLDHSDLPANGRDVVHYSVTPSAGSQRVYVRVRVVLR